MERQTEPTREFLVDDVGGTPSAYVAPRTTLESQISELWSDVLGIERIGIRDNFFSLGGDSLMGIQFIARLASRLGLEVSLRELFETPTIERLVSQLNTVSEFQFPAPTSDRQMIPLSSAQRRLWFIDRLKGGSAAYHICEAFRMRGALDRGALELALSSLLQRHEALRTVFVETDGEPMQRILPPSRFSLDFIDLADMDQGERQSEIDRLVAHESTRPFDLSHGPLIRGSLLSLANDDWILIVVMHHMISDGWSVSVFNRELEQLYATHVGYNPSASSDLTLQYADFARWQRQHSSDTKVKDQLNYWKEYLRGAPELIEIPLDRPRPAIQSQRGASVPFVLDAELTSDLKVLSQRCGVTLASIFYAALAIVLSKLSSQDDVVIGMPAANRRRPELERLIGFFVNTLAIRVRLDDEMSVTALLHQVREGMLDAAENQDVPFEEIVEALQPVRSLQHSPVFQVMFAVQNVPRKAMKLPGIELTEMEIPALTSEFDLLLTVQEMGSVISGNLIYASDLFDRTTIERWVGYFRRALGMIVQVPDQKVRELQLISPAEHIQVIEDFNRSSSSIPISGSIHELFEAQVRRNPDRLATVFEERSLTYAELNANANQLARYLIGRGVRDDEPIAICLDRSIESVVGLLGILKAGGAYVPLDASHPPSRLAHILHDTRTRFVLVRESLRDKLPTTEAAIVALDTVWSEIAQYEATEVHIRPAEAVSRRLAYIIYTSGSTGLPKGVLVEHRNVVNHWHALQPLYRQPVDCSRIGVNAPFTFDASVQQLVQLLSGCTLFLVPSPFRLDPSQLFEFVDRHQIDGIDCTPSQLSAWLSAGLLDRRPRSVQTVLVGGEAIDPQLWSTLGRSADITFYNVYGPTECTVDSTFARVHDRDPVPHIGQPMMNTRIYILDGRSRAVPIGVRGEIFIGGAGVSRGYLNRPELTAERFLPDPFCKETPGRMYKTGDIGRWGADGTVEYLGRNDHQVKIRGFRIELGEIETHLVAHPHVREAAVLAQREPSGEKSLVAYLVSKERGTLNPDELKAHLRTLLPAHMVPNDFVVLERFPMTSSGKIDRTALTRPASQAQPAERYQRPIGEVEQTLANIWGELLHTDKFGCDQSFFEVGGHSLLAIKLLFRINRSFGSAWTVAEIYKHSTIRDQATRLQGSSVAEEIVDLVKEAAFDPKCIGICTAPSAHARRVFLTGGTGFVGRFLLAHLLHASDATIYCLVRAGSPEQAMQRLKSTLMGWSLWQDEFESRLVPVVGDMSLSHLGCDESEYELLSRDTDVIYHCATRMNHLETYAMAKRANVDSTRELLKIATSGKGKPINYISTLGVFNPTAYGTDRVVNERTPIDHEKHSSSHGYAASKWVSEKIILTAMERGVACNIFRLGLIWADTQQGRYDELQREYRILKSCLLAGYAIQSYRCGMPPTPVDYVARSVAFLANRYPHGGGIFHITSPYQKIDGLFERCNALAGTALTLLSYRDWVSKIRQLHLEGQSLPVLPLLEGGLSENQGPLIEEPHGNSLERLGIDAGSTHRELEKGGIAAPVFDDGLLTTTLQGMFTRDIEMRDWLRRKSQAGMNLRYA